MKSLKIAAAFFAMATGSAFADENRLYRDVYYGKCFEAHSECARDWGSGMCRIPSYALGHKIITSEVLFGEGGGGYPPETHTTCVWLSPIYKTRARPLVQPMRIIILDKATREISTFGWLDPKASGGGGD